MTTATLPRLVGPLFGVLLSFTSGGPVLAGEPDRSANVNYILRCAGCHGTGGAGTEAGGIPDFRGFVGAFSRTGAGRDYLMHVPGVVSSSLSDAEIAAVVNHVMTTFASGSLPADYRPFTAEEVGERRVLRIDDVVAYRRKVVEDLAAHGIATAEYPWP